MHIYVPNKNNNIYFSTQNPKLGCNLGQVLPILDTDGRGLTDLCIPTSHIIDIRYSSKDAPVGNIIDNFRNGTVAFCLDKIGMHCDLHEALERIKKNRGVGQYIEQKVRETKSFTTGKLFNTKNCRVGQALLYVYKETFQNCAIKKREK